VAGLNLHDARRGDSDGAAQRDRSTQRFAGPQDAFAVVTVTSGTLAFVARMTSRREVDALPVYPADMRAQLRQVCENIGRALRSVGADFFDVVKATTLRVEIEAMAVIAAEGAARAGARRRGV
jgi:enamine deaminase RidA (YjgF/YER057c/UK114 family)